MQDFVMNQGNSQQGLTEMKPSETTLEPNGGAELWNY